MTRGFADPPDGFFRDTTPTVAEVDPRVRYDPTTGRRYVVVYIQDTQRSTTAAEDLLIPAVATFCNSFIPRLSEDLIVAESKAQHSRELHAAQCRASRFITPSPRPLKTSFTDAPRLPCYRGTRPR